jgi:spore maturation protein CgeB
MTILLAGYHNPRFPTITDYIEEAVEELGHTLVKFDNRSYRIPGRIRERVQAIERAELRRINRDLVRVAEDHRPDVFVETGGHRILPSTVDRMRRLSIATALWTIDAPTEFDSVLRAAPHYDRVVCGGTEAVELLQRSGVESAEWLPFACAPRHHHPVSPTDEDRGRFGNDVAFVGSYYPNRAEALRAVADLDLAIWGPGWERLAVDDPLASTVRGGHLSHAEWSRVYSVSKVVIVVHYQDGRTPCFQASPKVFEALACGAFVVVDDQKDVFSLFEDGRHLVRFQGPGDLVEKVRDWLDRPDDRERIASTGREAAISKHTYRQRVSSLLDGLRVSG